MLVLVQRKIHRDYRAVTVFNVILSSIQFMEIPGWLIAVSSFVFIAILFFGLIHRGKDSIKTVFFKCLIKGNVVSVTIFWGIIFSGILSNCISNHIEKKQESIDKEEFELAIKQFQKVTVYNQAFIPKDLRDFASGWQYLNQQQSSKAATYLKKASSECAYAAYLYGMSLYSGLGVQPDKYQAIKYLDMAADKEVFDAKNLLMTHYFRMNDYATEFISRGNEAIFLFSSCHLYDSCNSLIDYLSDIIISASEIQKSLGVFYSCCTNLIWHLVQLPP